MNFNLHFGELHSNNSINDKNNLFENYILKCHNVKRILISFNCFSEYILILIGSSGCLKEAKTMDMILDNFQIVFLILSNIYCRYIL